jgi:hypothetical protein
MMDSSLPALERLDPAWFVGGALVGFHSYFRFNTPPTSRSLTTAGRYHTAAMLYTFTMVSAWLVFASFPGLLGDLVPEDTRRLSVPLYVSLALTVLLPEIKALSRYDERLRAFLHDLARIPYEAVRLTGILQRVPFEPDQDTQIRVKALLAEADLRDKDVVFGAHRDPRTLWTKIATLKYHLDGWETSRRFARFRHAHTGEFAVIDDTYQTLLARAKRLFHQAEVLGADRQDPALSALLQGLGVEFTREAEVLEKRMCQTISQGVLQSTLTERARTAALTQLGFGVEEEEIACDRLFDKLVGLFLGLAAYYAAVVIIFGTPGQELHEKVVRGLMIAAIYIGAVFWAILPKRWRFGRVNAAGRPIRAYALSAAAAFGFSFVASTAVGALFGGDIGWALEQVRNKWPWSLMAFTTALVTAINIDTPVRQGLRWIETGIQASSAAIAIAIVRSLLALACHTCFLPPLIPLVVSAAVTGAVIGFCVPSWYRDCRTASPEGGS